MGEKEAARGWGVDNFLFPSFIFPLLPHLRKKLKMSAISKSSSLILKHYQTNLDLCLTRSLRINRLALTPIIDQDKFFNIKQCEEDM